MPQIELPRVIFSWQHCAPQMRWLWGSQSVSLNQTWNWNGPDSQGEACGRGGKPMPEHSEVAQGQTDHQTLPNYGCQGLGWSAPAKKRNRRVKMTVTINPPISIQIYLPHKASERMGEPQFDTKEEILWRDTLKLYSPFMFTLCTVSSCIRPRTAPSFTSFGMRFRGFCLKRLLKDV